MSTRLLADLSVRQFVTELGASSPTPGGGAGAALAGSLAAALAQMVGNLTVNRKKYQEVQGKMEVLAADAGRLAQELLVEMDADADAYDQVMRAFKLPKSSDEEKTIRQQAVDAAYELAIRVPARTARLCLPILALAKDATLHGNINAISDGLVSAFLAEAAFKSAVANVRTNLPYIKNEQLKNEMADLIETQSITVSEQVREVERAAAERMRS